MSAPRHAKRRVDELRKEIGEHDHRYYALDDPTVGDDVYDALLDDAALGVLWRAHPGAGTSRALSSAVRSQRSSRSRPS